jgi:hypothetical protein
MSDSITYPYSYRAFGLNILSQLFISGFESASIDKVDVYIHEGNVPESLNRIINTGVLYQSNETEFLLRLQNIANYYVKNGNEIIIQRKDHSKQGDVSAFLTGTSFGALLQQRRLIALHASTVLYKNKCIIIAGMSGVGKSTLAAAIIMAGGILVADDISVIDFSGEDPVVCPAFPAIKLWEDSLRHLSISSTGLEPVRKELKKYYLPIPKYSCNSKTITHIFILNTHNRIELDIKSLYGIDNSEC